MSTRKVSCTVLVSRLDARPAPASHTVAMLEVRTSEVFLLCLNQVHISIHGRMVGERPQRILAAALAATHT